MNSQSSYSGRSALIGLILLGCGLSACHKPDEVRPTPAATGTPVAMETVQPTSTPSPELSRTPDFEEVTQRYEVPIPEGSDGYPLLKQLLSEEGEPPDLNDSDGVQRFDAEYLPVLKEAFQKPHFAADDSLVVGEYGEVNYLGVRTLVNLLLQRADLLWREGERQQALELVALPLELSDSMQSRPETVSVNLFSSSYADAAVGQIQAWIEESELTPGEYQSLKQTLSEHAPEYEHVEETVTVDFAQLLNSLETEEGRNRLGIGTVEESTLDTWRDQLGEIFVESQALYGEAPVDPEIFNRSVREASGPIQGLVIDYPEVATMQKHAYAKYKATELGLALLSEGEDWKEKSDDKLLQSVFAAQPEEVNTLSQMLDVELSDEGFIKVEGSKEHFDRLLPGVEPVFFEYQASGPESP